MVTRNKTSRVQRYLIENTNKVDPKPTTEILQILARQYDAEAATLRKALLRIRSVLAPHAADTRHMQLAGPARQCTNIIRDALAESDAHLQIK